MERDDELRAMKMRRTEHDNSDLRLMELAARNPSLGGRDLLLEIIERGPAPEANERPNPRDVRMALRTPGMDDPGYRTQIEHAEWLSRESRMMRDLYERGAGVKGDVLIIPAEAHDLADDRETPFITTLSYAQKRIGNVEQAREFHSLAQAIAGETADARMQIAVFKHYYDGIEDVEQVARHERAEMMKGALDEMRSLASEMEKLETRESIEASDATESHNVESAPGRMNVAARKVNLRDESLRFPAGLNYETKERLVSRTIPEIDRRLEGGISREAISQAIDNTIFRSDSNPLADRKLEERIGIAGFLKDYVGHRLRDPETRALNTSPAFREARVAIIETTSPEEIGRVAAAILRVNQQRSEEMRRYRAEPETCPPPRLLPLSSRERNLLFNGRAPDHHTPEMRELRLNYGLSRRERNQRVTDLRDGRSEPSIELQAALRELDSRRTAKAVAHFQASLLNETMEKPGAINLHHLQQQLLPQERAFLFERSEERKELLTQPDRGKIENEQRVRDGRGFGQAPRESRSFQEYLAAMGQIERQLLNEAVIRQNPHSDRATQNLSITDARNWLPQRTRDEVRMQARNLAWDHLVPEEVFERHPLLEALRVSETISHLQEQLQDRARIAQNARDDFVAEKVATAERTKIEGEAVRESAEGRKEFVREVIESLSASEANKLAALEQYATQTREEVYQGFEMLDAQRRDLDLRRVQNQIAQREVEASRAYDLPPNALGRLKFEIAITSERNALLIERSEIAEAGRPFEPPAFSPRAPSVDSIRKWQFDSLHDVLPTDLNPPLPEERDREEFQHER